MMKKELQIRASRSPHSIAGDKIELYAFQEGDGGNLIAETLSLKRHEEYVLAPPFTIIKKAEAQVLMDDLWLTGLRPSEGTGSAGSLKATQLHLADLKRILFHKLGIKDT